VWIWGWGGGGGWSWSSWAFRRVFGLGWAGGAAECADWLDPQVGERGCELQRTHDTAPHPPPKAHKTNNLLRHNQAFIHPPHPPPLHPQVTHSCKQWMGLIRRDWGITLTTYFDTQQVGRLACCTAHRSGCGVEIPSWVGWGGVGGLRQPDPCNHQQLCEFYCHPSITVCHKPQLQHHPTTSPHITRRTTCGPKCGLKSARLPPTTCAAGLCTAPLACLAGCVCSVNRALVTPPPPAAADRDAWASGLRGCVANTLAPHPSISKPPTPSQPRPQPQPQPQPQTPNPHPNPTGRQQRGRGHHCDAADLQHVPPSEAQQRHARDEKVGVGVGCWSMCLGEQQHAGHVAAVGDWKPALTHLPNRPPIHPPTHPPTQGVAEAPDDGGPDHMRSR